MGRGAPGRPKINKDSIGRYITSDGYVRVRQDHVIGRDKWVSEHRLVMESMLGRKLYKGETVHHKDGNKQNNSPSNLELWVSKQPSGQRPEDLLAWAYEIIERYGP